MIHSKFPLILSATFLAFCTLASAHDNVVVIPLFGDDVLVVPEVEPSAPIAYNSPFNLNYTVNNFTIVDNRTKLEWQREDDGIERNWEDAWNYCANLNIVGFDRWRLPNPTELQSLVVYRPELTTLISSQFTNTIASDYWSASPRAYLASGAWAVNFSSGSIQPWASSNNHYVRCVR